MARHRLATRLQTLAAHLANRDRAHGASLVILLIGHEEPHALTAEDTATLAWEQTGAVIGPRTKVVLIGTCADGPQ